MRVKASLPYYPHCPQPLPHTRPLVCIFLTLWNKYLSTIYTHTHARTHARMHTHTHTHKLYPYQACCLPITQDLVQSVSLPFPSFQNCLIFQVSNDRHLQIPSVPSRAPTKEGLFSVLLLTPPGYDCFRSILLSEDRQLPWDEDSPPCWLSSELHLLQTRASELACCMPPGEVGHCDAFLVSHVAFHPCLSFRTHSSHPRLKV